MGLRWVSQGAESVFDVNDWSHQHNILYVHEVSFLDLSQESKLMFHYFLRSPAPKVGQVQQQVLVWQSITAIEQYTITQLHYYYSVTIFMHYTITL